MFELDSLLIVMMMQGRWGCHRKHLLVLLAECYDLSVLLTRAGCNWSIRHIYREYNAVADALAGACLQNSANEHDWRLAVPDSDSDSDWFGLTESTTAAGSTPSAWFSPTESTTASGSTPSAESTPP